jgi:hypothetical protein
MSELFWNTVTENMRLVLREFSQTQIGAKFYLAGGTALSLQLGHRRSVDLDFFSPTEDIPTIRGALEKSLAPLQPELADSSWGNLVYLVKNVRIGFYGYGYPLLVPLVEVAEGRLASVEDIALMKLDALLGRAARKDFYDLYFICQKISLRHLLKLAPKKYSAARDFETQAVKRLIYFESADQDIDLLLLSNVSWQEVKSYFIQQSKEIADNWLK